MGPTPMGVSAADVRALVRRYAEVIAEHKTYLTDLDAAIGDADHGENMDRGMAAVVRATGVRTAAGPADAADASDASEATEPDEPVAAVLKTVASTLISKVGGAAGPLYGTLFLRASTAVAGKPELTPADVVSALRAGYDGLLTRGKAEPGDKTMVDAWDPAVRAAEQALSDGEDLPGILSHAAEAADAGTTGTIELVARKGRASYLGERSAGHQDPGATSSALLFRTLAELPCR